MKKLLAILLSALLVFCCYATLFVSPAAAEEGNATEKESELTSKVIMQSDFDKSLYIKDDTTTSRWRPHLIDYKHMVGEEDGIPYAEITAKTPGSISPRYISSSIMLVPTAEYEISFELRVPDVDSSNFSYVSNNDGTQLTEYRAPFFDFKMRSDQNVTASGQALPGSNLPNSSINSPTFTWQVDGYNPIKKTSPNCNIGSASDVLPLLGVKTTDSNTWVHFKDVFADWIKITLKFTTSQLESTTPAYFSFLFENEGDAIQIRNFEVREYGYERVVFESNLDKETGNMTPFDGNKLNMNSQYVEFVDNDGSDNKDGVVDYIQVTAQKDKVTSVSTTPFYISPYNEYELTYKIRIPNNSGTYSYSGKYAFTPEFMIYEVNNSELVNGKPGVSGTSDNYYARGTGCRQSFSYTISFKYGEITKSISRSQYSLLDYRQTTQLFDGVKVGETEYNSTVDVKDLFAEKWVEVTVKFAGLPSNTNAGPQLVVASMCHSSMWKSEGRIFQFKDIKIEEFDRGKVNPDYSKKQVHFEDFNYNTVDYNVVSKLYNTVGGEARNILEDSKNKGKGDYNLVAYAPGAQIFLPLDRSFFVSCFKYNIAFDWMLLNSSQFTSAIDSVYFAAFKDVNADGEIDDVEFNAGKELFTANIANKNATGNYQTLTLDVMLNDYTTMNFDNFGIVITYHVDRTQGDTHKVNEALYIDDLVVKEIPETQLNGDYNMNGKVDLDDVTLLAKHLTGWDESLFYVDDKVADYHKDEYENVNVFDLVALARTAAGWEDYLTQ